MPFTIKTKTVKANHTTDIELVQLFQSGEVNAFKQLVQRHQEQVRKTVIGMLGEGAEAEDVAQEVFINFYKKIDSFRGESKLSTYLTRIAINLSLNEIKKRKRNQSRYLSIDKEENIFQISDKKDYSVQIETKEIIHKALANLDEDYRVVIVLRMIDGYSTKEVSEILQLPMGTVGTRLARGQKKLKEILKKYL